LRPDGDSFEVKASAPGKVIYIGWDDWSGNTIVVSHEVDGVPDAYRTIYMHLRNGPTNDCEMAWKETVPSLSGVTQTQYKSFLDSTGCPEVGPRKPDPTYWGTDADIIDQVKLFSMPVSRGDVLAHSGETGPGGCDCTDASDPTYVWGGNINTHLHIFYARRDPTDLNWYFFDPYGIYASPECYPTEVTDPVTDTQCQRYPSRWLNDGPAYP
jgi:hypothetical protein